MGGESLHVQERISSDMKGEYLIAFTEWRCMSRKFWWCAMSATHACRGRTLTPSLVHHKAYVHESTYWDAISFISCQHSSEKSHSMGEGEIHQSFSQNDFSLMHTDQCIDLLQLHSEVMIHETVSVPLCLTANGCHWRGRSNTTCNMSNRTLSKRVCTKKLCQNAQLTNHIDLILQTMEESGLSKDST